MPDPNVLDQQIDSERNNLRTDKLDLTYGELSSMYEDDELIVAPEYQRLFRWENMQKAKFIESILLGFPIPAIFVAEGETGVWELVDGLQRLSTVLEFMGLLKNADGEPVPPSRLILDDTKMRLPALHAFSFEEMSLRSRLSLKRAACRVEVIKVGSAPKMKYDVFERLNTGSAGLTEQEVRNCIFRATNPHFMKWVDDLAKYDPFSNFLGLSDFQASSMYDRGLVLRFVTLKNGFEGFRHDVEPFITEYVRNVVEGQIDFGTTGEEDVFKTTFSLIAEALGDDAWRHYREGKHRGAFSVYVFDALSIGVARNLDVLRGMSPSDLRDRLIKFKESSDFLGNVGPGANTRAKMQARLTAAVATLGGPKDEP